MAGATSLANALDIAASASLQFDSLPGGGGHTTVQNGQIQLGTAAASKVGLLDWFQFQGNTYIVEALNTGAAPAAHAALGTGDVVVELAGLVNIPRISLPVILPSGTDIGGYTEAWINPPLSGAGFFVGAPPGRLPPRTAPGNAQWRNSPEVWQCRDLRFPVRASTQFFRYPSPPPI